MNFTALIGLLPYILQGIDLARSINNQKTGGAKVIDIVQGNLPQVLDLFSGVGKTLFPELSHPAQVAAAAVVLDPDMTKNIQTKLNSLGLNPPLNVDGVYGAKTKASVAAFQQAHPPLVVDGWAGAATQAVMFPTA